MGWTRSGSCGAETLCTSSPVLSMISVGVAALRTSTTPPKLSTKMKCSATEIVKNRERLSRPMNVRTARLRGFGKEKAAIGVEPDVPWQGKQPLQAPPRPRVRRTH